MRVLIIITILVAMVLAIYPLPFHWRAYRPEFIALLVIYWSMYTPQYFGLGASVTVGLSLDLLVGAELGTHALGLLVIAYISQVSYRRIRSYAEWQQSAWVFVFVGIYQLFANWVSEFYNQTVQSPIYIFALVLTAALWPFLVRLLLTLRLKWRLQ